MFFDICEYVLVEYVVVLEVMCIGFGVVVWKVMCSYMW